MVQRILILCVFVAISMTHYSCDEKILTISDEQGNALFVGEWEMDTAILIQDNNYYYYAEEGRNYYDSIFNQGVVLTINPDHSFTCSQVLSANIKYSGEFEYSMGYLTYGEVKFRTPEYYSYTDASYLFEDDKLKLIVALDYGSIIDDVREQELDSSSARLMNSPVINFYGTLYQLEFSKK